MPRGQRRHAGRHRRRPPRTGPGPGHPATDAPAYAWVEGLRKTGDRLQAKFRDIAPAFREAVEAGRNAGRSIAIKDGKLRHVGFLGGRAPAMPGLAPTQFAAEPDRVGEDARSSSGVGKLVGAGVSFSPALADDLRAALAVSATAKFYDRSDWNDISVSGEIGLTRLSDRGSVSGGLRLGRRWLGGDPISGALALGPGRAGGSPPRRVWTLRSALSTATTTRGAFSTAGGSPSVPGCATRWTPAP